MAEHSQLAVLIQSHVVICFICRPPFEGARGSETARRSAGEPTLLARGAENDARDQRGSWRPSASPRQAGDPSITRADTAQTPSAAVGSAAMAPPGYAAPSVTPDQMRNRHVCRQSAAGITP